jgi:hypothetical protein
MGLGHARFNGNRIVESWYVYDLFGVIHQVGVRVADGS